MGRLIDEDILIGSIPDLNAFEEEDFCTSDMVHLIEDTPTVEAIPKAEYESRLKADMAAMLTEIQLEIADNVESIIGHYDASTPERKRPLCKSARNEGRTECIDIIQQKIDALRGNNENSNRDR